MSGALAAAAGVASPTETDAPAAAAAAAAAAPAAPLSNHESFLLILHDSSGRAALLDYLKSGYSEHHLVFWEEATQVYAKLATQAERESSAREMWQRYIKNGSKSQINITETQRLRLQRAVEQIGQQDPSTGESLRGPGSDLFDDAASTCPELIKGNYFFPFQSSKQFERYRAEKDEKGRVSEMKMQQQQQQEQERTRALEQQAAGKKDKSAACVIL